MSTGPSKQTWDCEGGLSHIGGHNNQPVTSRHATEDRGLSCARQHGVQRQDMHRGGPCPLLLMRSCRNTLPLHLAWVGMRERRGEEFYWKNFLLPLCITSFAPLPGSMLMDGHHSRSDQAVSASSVDVTDLTMS